MTTLYETIGDIFSPMSIQAQMQWMAGEPPREIEDVEAIEVED